MAGSPSVNETAEALNRSSPPVSKLAGFLFSPTGTATAHFFIKSPNYPDKHTDKTITTCLSESTGQSTLTGHTFPPLVRFGYRLD
jgi:hypothetical protein